MRKILLLLFVVVFTMPAAFSQEEKNFDVELHGFVKYEMVWDSRQAIAARDGNVLLFPANKKLDSGNLCHVLKPMPDSLLMRKFQDILLTYLRNCLSGTSQFMDATSMARI